jgi:DNA invertase Pin-like site-specific DNA recombinase
MARDEHEAIFKELASGKYRDKYLLYNRKSTDDTDNQKNSISYQRAENLRFAQRYALDVAQISISGFCTDGIISERHSGFKENVELIFGLGNTVQYRVDRPKFHRLVQLLSGKAVRGVIFLCWDRASRNKGDDTILRKLMKAGVDIRFSLAQYDKTSAGELHMDIDGMFAEHHSRITREKVILATRAKRQQGVCTYRAPVGYLNLGQMEVKPLDPVRAPVVTRLFELAASGEWSLADLARWAIEQGFTMPPMRRRRTADELLAEEEDTERLRLEPIARPPTFNTIHKILTNPFYTGRVLGNDGAWVASTSHKALVSDQVFAEARRALSRNRQSAHYSDVLSLPLRGVLRCSCGRAYTPYVQKGHIYLGARCRPGCENSRPNVGYDHVIEKVLAVLGSLSFTDDERSEIEARAETDTVLLDQRRMMRLEEIERRKKRLRDDLSYIRSNRLTLLRTGVYTPEDLATEDAKLTTELEKLHSEEGVSDEAMAATAKAVIELSELLKGAKFLVERAKPMEQDRIVRMVFSELILSENSFDFQCNKGFFALQKRLVDLHDPTDWISELCTSGVAFYHAASELSSLLSSMPPSPLVDNDSQMRSCD